MDYQKAMQTFGDVADYNLAQARSSFSLATNYDGRTEKGRQAMSEKLVEIEKNLRIAEEQIRHIRILHSIFDVVNQVSEK